MCCVLTIFLFYTPTFYVLELYLVFCGEDVGLTDPHSRHNVPHKSCSCYKLNIDYVVTHVSLKRISAKLHEFRACVAVTWWEYRRINQLWTKRHRTPTTQLLLMFISNYMYISCTCHVYVMYRSTFTATIHDLSSHSKYNH